MRCAAFDLQTVVSSVGGLRYIPRKKAAWDMPCYEWDENQKYHGVCRESRGVMLSAEVRGRLCSYSTARFVETEIARSMVAMVSPPLVEYRIVREGVG